MTETDNIVLEHLRRIRGAIDDVRDDIRKIKQRVGSLENQYAICQIGLIGWTSASNVSSGVST